VSWDDPTESIPAFLTLVIMPPAVSITDEGVAFAVVSYAALKPATGRGGEAHLLIDVFAAWFMARDAFLFR
jgi:adenine/guanine/hypoxanthine permease